MKCRYCRFANFIINKCLIDDRKLYDKGVGLVQGCKNYKDGDWVAEMNCEINRDKGSD